jgi:Uma2 family endonuclease
VREFHRLYEAGILPPDERAELVEGEIFELSPMNPEHATGMRKVRRALLAAFGEGFVVSDQLPLVLDSETEVYPDFSVCAGDLDDYADHHPTTASLVVEVSDTTARFDRGKKASLYATAGIEEYWIVDLARRRVEVRREPGGAAEGGAAECQITLLYAPGQTISPICSPDASIAVDELLPRAKEPNS